MLTMYFSNFFIHIRIIYSIFKKYLPYVSAQIDFGGENNTVALNLFSHLYVKI